MWLETRTGSSINPVILYVNERQQPNTTMALWETPHTVWVSHVKWCQHYAESALSLCDQFSLIYWPVLLFHWSLQSVKNMMSIDSRRSNCDGQQLFGLHMASCSPCRLPCQAWAFLWLLAIIWLLHWCPRIFWKKLVSLQPSGISKSSGQLSWRLPCCHHISCTSKSQATMCAYCTIARLCHRTVLLFFWYLDAMWDASAWKDFTRQWTEPVKEYMLARDFVTLCLAH